MLCKMYIWLMSLVAMGLMAQAQAQQLTYPPSYPPAYPPAYPPPPPLENTAMMFSPPSTIWNSVLSLFVVAVQGQNQLP